MNSQGETMNINVSSLTNATNETVPSIALLRALLTQQQQPAPKAAPKKPVFRAIETGYLHKAISQPMSRKRKNEFRVLENFVGREQAIKLFREKLRSCVKNFCFVFGP